MSTRPSTSTGGTGGVPSNVHLNITAAPKQYIWYGGERYLVQAFQKGTGPGGTDIDITDARDWTEAGLAAMKAADKVFQRNSVNIAEVKTVQVPLTGEVSIEEGKATQAANIKIGSNIQYAKTVTNKPTTPIILKPEDLQSIQDEITEIGQATATWKDPTLSHQRSQQQGAATSQRTDTHTPQATPIDSTPTNPSTTPEIQLPQLTFAPPTPYQHDQGAALSSFLKSQQTGSATSPINTHQENKPASEAISAQLTQFNLAETHIPEALHKGVASYIANHLSNFANNPTDSEEMFTALKTQYDASTGNLAALKTKLKDGVARSTNIDDRDYSKLEHCLANRQPSQPLTPEEKLLVAKAFANLIHKTPHTDTQSYSKVYFKAMHAFFDTEKVGTTMGFGGTEQSSGKSLVIVESTTTGDYKIWGRWPESGTLRPDRTAFILYNSTAGAGKFSGFSRTTGMDARNPLEPSVPQTGITTRPAYYTDRQDIETGGSGNCGAFALADAILQKNQTYYRTESDWKAALAQQKVGIRQNAMQFLFNHAEQFTTDELFPEVLESINESKSEIIMQQRSNGPALRALLDKEPGSLTPEQKKWLVQLYAVYAVNEGKDLDKPFYLAHAMSTGQKIAIIQGNQIIFTAPPANKAVSVDDYLFVHYDGLGHFKSVNRNYTGTHTTPVLGDIISQYNSENTYLFARKAFLGSFAQPNTIAEKLSKLKTDDPRGYLALQEIAGVDLVNNAAAGHNIDNFIAALEGASGIEENNPAQLAAAIDEQIKVKSHLEARSLFLSALIKVKTTTPPPIAGSAEQQALITALDRLKKEDMAGYLSIRTRLPAFDFDHIENDTDMTDLINNLTTATTLDGTAPDSVPGLYATEELRLQEIAKRKGSMLNEAGKHIFDTLNEPTHSHLKSRAEFLQELMKAPTGVELDQLRKGDLESLRDKLAENDLNGYFAYRAFVATPPDIHNWEDIVTHRDDLIAAIQHSAEDERIIARANVIKAVQTEEPAQITVAVRALQPQEHLALEILIGKGELTPEQMTPELQAFIRSPNNVTILVNNFANWIHSPATRGLSNFLDAFITYKEQVRLAAERSEAIPSSGIYGGAYRGESGLKALDPAAFLAIEDFRLHQPDHLETPNASMYLIDYKSVAEIKKAIADSRSAMTARARFLDSLEEVKASSTAIGEATTREKQQKTDYLAKAIKQMYEVDIHGFLGLVQITKQTNPTAIATYLINDDRNFKTFEHLFVPHLTGMTDEELRENRRGIYTPALDQTIYSPALIARGNLIKAAMQQPPAITPELWRAVKENDPVASLALGLLIYEIDKDTPNKIPAETDVLTPATQIAYGKAQIEEHLERIAEIPANKWNRFIELLATKKANEEANDLENIGT